MASGRADLRRPIFKIKVCVTPKKRRGSLVIENATPLKIKNNQSPIEEKNRESCEVK